MRTLRRKGGTGFPDNQIRGNPSTAYIGIDNDKGMDLAVAHLKDLGHKKIGYLSSALESHIMQVRYNAFFQAMKQHGLDTDPSLAGCSFFMYECMEKHLPRLLDMGVTALICGQDTIANAALVQCQQLGYKLPRDLSIIGFDDLPISPYTSPPLTTIRQDRINIGKCGYYAATSLLNGVSIGTILLHAQLIVRNSTGVPAFYIPWFCICKTINSSPYKHFSDAFRPYHAAGTLFPHP